MMTILFCNLDIFISSRLYENQKLVKTHGGAGYSQFGRYNKGCRTFSSREKQLLMKK